MNNQPKPEVKKYVDLIREIEKGEIKIPKFQRDFVWSLEKTANLLDSILKGYPIGTFILWETRERLNSIKNIGDLQVKIIEDGKIQYILDGQQRITSLYAAYLGAKIKRTGEKKVIDYSDIYLDLSKNVENSDDQIVSLKKLNDDFISLNKVLNLSIDFREMTKEQSDKIIEYNKAFTSYDFSTVVLRKEDIDSAIEVFTRINTSGQTLTLFEIMSAKTYDEKENFDMTDKFQNLLKELQEITYNTISSSVILHTLSLILSDSKECKRKVILQLDKKAIIKSWDSVISALKEAIDYLRSVYLIPVSALLPYDSLLVPFSYFFYHNKNKPSSQQSKFLEEFFWRVSLSRRYSSSTESKLAQDIKRIDKILENNRPNYDDIKVDLNSHEDLIKENFSAGSSYSKAILCLLAYHEPKDFHTNGKVILDNSWLKIANSKNYHHFFPKSYLIKNNIPNINSLVNITLISGNLNKGKIRAKAPSVYIQEFLNDNSDLPKTMKSHLISDLDDFGIKSNNYDVFLEKRAEVIFEELKKRINIDD